MESTDLVKSVDRVKSKFRRGVAEYREGFDRPNTYSPQQIGWDAAKELETIEKAYLEKARQEFGGLDGKY